MEQRIRIRFDCDADVCLNHVSLISFLILSRGSQKNRNIRINRKPKLNRTENNQTELITEPSFPKPNQTEPKTEFI